MAPNFTTEPFDTSGWHAHQRGVYEVWRALPRPQGSFPPFADFDPLVVSCALGWIWLYDIEREPFRLRCRLFGSKLAEHLGFDITGQYLDAQPLSDPKRPLDSERLRVSGLEGKPTYARMRPIMKYEEFSAEVENVLLPFAADGRTPDILLGVSTYYRADGQAV